MGEWSRYQSQADTAPRNSGAKRNEAAMLAAGDPGNVKDLGKLDSSGTTKATTVPGPKPEKPFEGYDTGA